MDADPTTPYEVTPAAALHSPPRRAGRLTRWAAGLGLAALLAGGGAALGAHLADGHPGRQAATMLAGGSPATAQDQALAAALGTTPAALATLTASSVTHLHGGHHAGQVFAGLRRCLARARQLRTSGNLVAARAARHACLRGSLRLRLLLLGAIHGQLTFRTKTGFRTVAFERGTVQSIAGTSVVVKSADGVSMTWDLVSKTVVFRAGHKVGVSTLAAGERVLVIGPVVGGADDARLILIRR